MSRIAFAAAFGLLIATPIFTALPAQAQTVVSAKSLRTLTVTGRGSESIKTTIAIVRLGVEAQGKTAAEVQAVVAKRSNSLVNLLKSRQVDKLQTTGISLNPTYDYNDGKQVFTGYTATNTVSFRTNNEAAGGLLDDSVKSGASRIDGISFTATDEAIAAGQKVALRKATQEAQAQAQAVLSALNFTQKEIVGIQIDQAVPQVRLAQTADFAAAKRTGAAEPSAVVGGEQNIEASVTLEISY